MMDMDVNTSGNNNSVEYVVSVFLDELCQRVGELLEGIWMTNLSNIANTKDDDCTMEMQYFETINEAKANLSYRGDPLLQSTPMSVESSDTTVVNIDSSINKSSINSETTVTSIPETILSNVSDAISDNKTEPCQDLITLPAKNENNADKFDESKTINSQNLLNLNTPLLQKNPITGFVINDNGTTTSENISEFISTPEVTSSGPSIVSSDATKLEVSPDKLIQSVTSTDSIDLEPQSNISEITSQSNILADSRPYIFKLIGESNHFGYENYFKGCKWSPDGLCYMTNSNDSQIRLFNTPYKCISNDFASVESPLELKDCLKVQEPGLIYDYCWWPLLNSQDPATCCFATTAINQPVHLWDAFNGTLRASYIAFNSVQEITSAYSLCFSNDGRQLLCGFKKDVCLFYTDRPGAHFERWSTMKKKQKKSQNNIISCVEFTSDDSMFACGSYDGTVGIYSSANGQLLDFTAAHSSGITHLKFSRDGYRLYTGIRNGNSIKCWDMRNVKTALFDVKRTVATNQRIYFDILYDSSTQNELSLISGSSNGFVSLWDIRKVAQSNEFFESSNNMNVNAPQTVKAHEDCVNGCCIHPFLPILATTSGQRLYPDLCDSDEEDDGSLLKVVDSGENKVKLWHFYNDIVS